MLALTGKNKSFHISFSTKHAQMCVSVWVREQRSWHTCVCCFFLSLYELYVAPPQQGMSVNPNDEMRGKERDKNKAFKESVASSAWLGIHNQTSQIRGNREDINAASKDKWERRGIRGEGRERKSLTQSSFDCNSFLSAMTYTCTLIDTLCDTLSANQCRWTLLFIVIKSIHFMANCCYTLPHTCRHLKCGLAHVTTWHTYRLPSSPSEGEMTWYLWSCQSLKT